MACRTFKQKNLFYFKRTNNIQKENNKNIIFSSNELHKNWKKTNVNIISLWKNISKITSNINMTKNNKAFTFENIYIIKYYKTL